jgi:ABC-2 type transport system permease protein
MMARFVRDPILQISSRQISGVKRLAIVTVLSAIPIVITSMVVGVEGQVDEVFPNSIVAGMFASAILPIVVMTLATAAFGNELEDKTLSYLVLKPVSRLRIVIPKYAVTVLMAGPLLVVSGVATTLVAFDADARTAAAVAVGLAVGVVTYSSVFMWLGLMTTHALGFALFYVFLWEGLLSTFLSGIRFMSVRSYTVSIMYGIEDSNLGPLGDISVHLATAAVGAGIVTVLFFYLTVRRLRRMDVP